jgi:hypothetical protein
MKTSTVEALVWVLIYGGLLLLCLGLFVLRADGLLGWPLVLAGGATSAVGAVLIVVRSRMGP